MSILNNLMGGGGKSDYRSDIDGLRAIACISVVLYHAFPSVLKGGFVGVDIFFVISGFLISSILYRNLFNQNAPGKVNIIDFYIRRIRRIFPALIAVMVTMLVVGWFVLFPDEYSLLGKHTLGGATYINNFMLYKESGSYFDVNSNIKPLLHLWSLGVEEQFYLVFPVFLWLIYKSNLNFVLSLTVFTVISFILNKNAINHNHQSAAFYLPWCRFWELSIGAILAYLINYNKDFMVKAKAYSVNKLPILLFRNSNNTLKESFVNNAISVLGLVVIIYGIVTIEHNLKFPGSKALIPVIGALLIIGAGKEAFINKHFLSNRLMVFLGLISYPLYLWHWPLLSLAYICEGQLPDVWIRWCAVGIALVLATFTFIVIEPPLRYGTNAVTKSILLITTIVALGSIGGYIFFNKGIRERFTKDELDSIYDIHYSLEEIDKINMPFFENCKKNFPNWEKNMTEDFFHTKCYMSTDDQNSITVALMGDSESAQLFAGLQSELSNNHDNSTQEINIASFSPFGLYGVHNNKDHNENNKQTAFDFVLNSKSIKVVILTNIFTTLINPYNRDQFSQIPFNNESDFMEKALKREIEVFLNHNKKVIVINHQPRLLSKIESIDSFISASPSMCNRGHFDVSKKECLFDLLREKDNILSDEISKRVVKGYNRNDVVLIDLKDVLCDYNLNKCILTDSSGKLLYLDYSHLNFHGSCYVAPFIVKAISNLLQKSQ